MNLSANEAPALRARHRPPALLVCASVLCWLDPAPAFAHGSLSIGEFYSGMLHPLLHFETVLPTLALALWAGQLRDADAWRLPLVFLTAALLGALAGIFEVDLGLGRSLLLLSMLVLGLLVAARQRLPAAVALTLALVFGLYSGQLNTYAPGEAIERPFLFLTGLAATLGLILFHVGTRVHRYRAFWMQTGVRVVGSWIAATGLLVLALEWGTRA
jgi:urease accessory protein